eukprot:1155543_1
MDELKKDGVGFMKMFFAMSYWFRLLSFLWITIISLCNAFSQSQPNFIIIITDDQDLELGSPQIMKNLHSKIIQNGITFTNSFISTPICCPSRTETMTGRYYHNVGAPYGSCMNVDGTGAVFNTSTMFQQFNLNGYTTGIFGKHVMNGPSYWCPKSPNISNPLNFTGYDRVFLMCGSADYYQPKYIDKYSNGSYLWTNLSLVPSSYQTSQIGNASLQWLQSLASADEQKPFLMWIGPHAPHEPAYPAEWYAEYTFNASINHAPRPISFNAYNKGKHAMVANNPSLTPYAEELIDELWRDRLKSLLSVDDLIGDIYDFLMEHQLLNNTYIYFSSDHGYHLGEFKVPCFKTLPYETDIRVPTYMIGPNIQPNTDTSIIVGNVDIYPTLLELARIDNADNRLNIDGKSFVWNLTDSDTGVTVPWREEYLVEYRAVGTTYFWICGIWTPDPETKSVFPGVTIAPPQGPPDMNETGPWYVNDKISSNFRMIRVLNSTHNLMYAEFVHYNWTQNDLKHPQFYELFDLNQDPFQLMNIYNKSARAIQLELHEMLTDYASCEGKNCV